VPKLPEPGPPPPRSEPAPPARAPESGEEKPPGVGHNGPPEDDSVPAPGETENSPAPGNSGIGRDQPFTLPIERPTGEGEIAQWGQYAAGKIREALANNDTKRLTEIADALAHADWIKEQLDNIRAIEESLRARGTEARKVLVPLLTYSGAPSPFAEDRTAQVRLNAAKELLAVVPVPARATLEHLAAHGPSAQSGDAGMCLQFLQDGVFKPT